MGITLALEFLYLLLIMHIDLACSVEVCTKVLYNLNFYHLIAPGESLFCTSITWVPFFLVFKNNSIAWIVPWGSSTASSVLSRGIYLPWRRRGQDLWRLQLRSLTDPPLLILWVPARHRLSSDPRRWRNRLSLEWDVVRRDQRKFCSHLAIYDCLPSVLKYFCYVCLHNVHIGPETQ